MPYTKSAKSLMNRVAKKMRVGKYRRGRQTYQKMKRVATAVLNKKTETKHTSFGRDDVSLYHNQQIVAGAGTRQPLTDLTFFNIWTSVLPGTGVVNRIGNEIIPRGISVRLYLENQADRPNLTYRIIFGLAPKTNVAGAATTYNNLELMDIGGCANNICRHIAQDAGYKILYDRVIRNEFGGPTDVSGGAKRSHKFVKLWIRPKKGTKIVYNTSNTGVISDTVNKRIFMTVIPYDSYNTLTTDNVAQMSYQAKLYWKDA